MDKPASETMALAVVPPRAVKKVKEKKYAPTFKVVLHDYTVVEVPVDKASSDAQRSIMVAKTRDFVAKQLQKLDGQTLTPQEIGQLVKAVADVDSLQREQFVTHLNNSGATPLGSGLQEMIRGAAQGAAAGTADGFLKKLQEFDRAAKRVEDAKARTIEA